MSLPLLRTQVTDVTETIAAMTVQGKQSTEPGTGIRPNPARHSLWLRAPGVARNMRCPGTQARLACPSCSASGWSGLSRSK